MPKLFDVIIVGAGPSGAMTAYELSKAGINVLIIEKEKLPRYKVCGGGIQYKLKKNIPFEFEDVLECKINAISFSNRLDNCFVRRHSNTLMFTVMRDKFDKYLADEAVQAGSKLVDGTCVEKVEIVDGHVEVKTSQGKFRSTVIIGADGANSIVARSQALVPSGSQSIGLETEVLANQNVKDRFQDLIHLDWGTIPRGYAWVFPKRNCLSIGVGGPSSLAKNLKKYNAQFLEYLGLAKCRILSSKGHLLPFRKSGSMIFRNSSILVGDAAGLIDPFTGEGLWGAIKSAQIAASCIIEFFNHNSPLSDYQKRVDHEIMPELRASTSIMHFFNTTPSLFHNHIKNNDKAWNAMCKILRGEKTFIDIENKFGQVRYAWKACAELAGYYESLKIKALVTRN